MQALVVVDAQNEFSPKGLRAVPNHEDAMKQIHRQVERARREKRPIAWVKHYNRPDESAAFVPKTWGAEFSDGLGPQEGFGPEKLFTKDVFGAFTFTGLEEWLRSFGVQEVLLVGFFTHMCVSTSAREALVRGFEVWVDPAGTGAHDLAHPVLGSATADAVRRMALLQLADMGAKMVETSFGEMVEQAGASFA